MLDILGERARSRHHQHQTSELSSSIASAMRTFPKNCKHLSIDFCNILIGKFEIEIGLFENFGKLEDGVSKFSNIPIFGRNQMNEPNMSY